MLIIIATGTINWSLFLWEEKSMNVFIEQAGMSLLVGALLLYYGIRMILTGDAGVMRRNSAQPLKDEKQYAKEGGKLVIIMAIGSFVMGILMLFNVYVAIAEICLVLLVVGCLWKSMNGKYGA